MSAFDNYSKYYDLIYSDKDYQGESDYILNLIKRYSSQAQKVLELGCGTGHHAELLVKQNLSVQGIDLSEKMLQCAIERREKLPENFKHHLKFSQGDIRHFNLNQTFDVALALFHVISYQTSNNDLMEVFATVRKHLKQGGIFIFDVWYGPTVLTDRPVVRVKRCENDLIQVTRIAEPEMLPNENIVNVKYDIDIYDKEKKTHEKIDELHRMRYLFTPEIMLILESTGFALLGAEEWMSGDTPGFDTWGVCFIVKGI